eukprot:scaffold7949_cov73-Isochrysis_galbana.AAC.1
MIASGGSFRVLKFGTKKTLLVPRVDPIPAGAHGAPGGEGPPPPITGVGGAASAEEGESVGAARAEAGSLVGLEAASQVALSWNGSSGGTYMWHMIEEDVMG